MPPAYRAPGPIGIFNGYANANRGSGSGGGFQGYYQAQDPTGLYQNRLEQTGLEGVIQGDLSNQRFVQQGQLQAQRAELDAWEYNQRVTSQESMQLRQDQNSIAAIDQDPTMTPLEKQQAKLRIRTRIDWVSERQKRDLQQAQVEQAQAHAAMFKQQAALDQQRITNAAAIAQNMTKTLTDPSRGPELARMVRSMGIDPTGPEGPALMDRLAAEKGWTQTFAIDKDGAVVGKPLFVGPNTVMPGSAGSERSARSSTGGKGVATDESAGQAGHGFDSSMELAIKAAGPGADRAAIMSAFDAIMEKRGQHMSKYQEGTPAGRLAQAKKDNDQALFAAQQSMDELRADTSLPPGYRNERMKTLNQINSLLRQYPPESNPPKTILEHIRRLQEHDNKLAMMKPKPSDNRGQGTGAARVGEPQKRTLVGDLRRIQGGIDRSIDKYGTQASEAIDSNVKSLFNYLGG